MLQDRTVLPPGISRWFKGAECKSGAAVDGSSAASVVPPIVYVVDDDISVRESLEGLICAAGWQAFVFASAKEFLSHSCASCPSCLVLDVTLPGLSGLDLQQRVARERADIPIIFITACSDVLTTVRAMKAGAVEFLVKPFSSGILFDAMRAAIERSRAAIEHEAELRLLRVQYASLSQREKEVMELVVQGLLNKQVGAELGISEITVKAHRGRVMRKMKADSLAGLVRIAAKLPIPQRDLLSESAAGGTFVQGVKRPRKPCYAQVRMNLVA